MLTLIPFEVKADFIILDNPSAKSFSTIGDIFIIMKIRLTSFENDSSLLEFIVVEAQPK
jgi:hypothetical protein